MHRLIVHVKQELFRRQTPEFIASDMWLPNSADLNSLDYRIWGVTQERAYQTPIQDIARVQCT